MKLYIDDAGAFSPGADGLSVICGVGFPESKEHFVRQFVSQFESQLTPEEFEKRTPKGKKLTDKSRDKLAQWIRRKAPFVRITVGLFDHEFNSLPKIEAFRSAQCAKYSDQLSPEHYAFYRERLSTELLEELRITSQRLLHLLCGREEQKKMSGPEIAKVHTVFRVVDCLIQNCITALSSGKYDRDWGLLVSTLFDEIGETRPTAMEDYLRLNFHNMLAQRKEILTLPERWKRVGPQHPFLAKFCSGGTESASLNKLFIPFATARPNDVAELRLTDYIASMIRREIADMLKERTESARLSTITPNLSGNVEGGSLRMEVIMFDNKDRQAFGERYADITTSKRVRAKIDRAIEQQTNHQILT